MKEKKKEINLKDGTYFIKNTGRLEVVKEKENIYKKTITKKFYIMTILIILLGVFSLVDILTTLIALNLPYLRFYEANPYAYFFVERPLLWVLLTVSFLVVYSFTSLLLWYFDEKHEKVIDLVSICFMFFIATQILIRGSAVVNNIIQFYIALS